MEPERLLLRRFLHVSLLALPGAGVLRPVGTETPDLADRGGDLLGDEVGAAVHRSIVGRISDEIGWKHHAVLQHDRILGEVADIGSGFQFDAHRRLRYRRPGAATQIFHEQAGGVGPIFIQLATSDEDCLAVPL